MRKSPEDRSGAMFRAGSKPLAPPAGLSPDERRMWIAITSSKPVGFFDPSNAAHLLLYVRSFHQTRLMADRLSQTNDDALARNLERRLSRLTATTMSLARQLRLTKVAVADRESGELTETAVAIGEEGNELTHDRWLIGGSCVWGPWPGDKSN